MPPPLSIRGSTLPLGSLWDEETSELEQLVSRFEKPMLMIVDSVLSNAIRFATSSDIAFVELSKAKIDCDKPIVLFLLKAEVVSSRLAAFQIRTIKETNKTAEFHIAYVPKKSFMCTQCLKEEDVLGDVSLHSLGLTMYPIEEDLISCEINNSFKRLYIKDDRMLLMEMMENIIKLQKYGGLVDTIHAIGDRAVSMMELLMKRKRELIRDYNDIPRRISQLIMVDRSVDFASLFVTPTTYEGLIDELIGITMNRICVDGSIVGRKEEKATITLSNDDDLYGEIRDQNVCVLPQSLKNRLYAIQTEMMNATQKEGDKPFSQQDVFTQLQIHQGLSELLTNTTNSYLFRQRWQMEHEILNGERFLDYLVERITLQDSLQSILRLLILYSLVNGGLKNKEYDTIKKEVIQTYGYETMLVMNNLEIAGLLVKKEQGRNYSAIRNKLMLVKENLVVSNVLYRYCTSGYAPISSRLIEMILKGKRIPTDVIRLLGCDYDYSTIQLDSSLDPTEKPTTVICFLGGVTHLEMAAIRYLKRNDESSNIIIMTTNVTNGNQVIEEMKNNAPLKLPALHRNQDEYNMIYHSLLHIVTKSSING